MPFLLSMVSKFRTGQKYGNIRQIESLVLKKNNPYAPVSVGKPSSMGDFVRFLLKKGKISYKIRYFISQKITFFPQIVCDLCFFLHYQEKKPDR